MTESSYLFLFLRNHANEQRGVGGTLNSPEEEIICSDRGRLSRLDIHYSDYQSANTKYKRRSLSNSKKRKPRVEGNLANNFFL